VLVGGGGERDARHVRVALVQHAQAQVVFAEIVAPLADAMGLVDGKEAEQTALVERIELGQKARRGQALGGGIEHHQLAGHHHAFDALHIVKLQCAVEEGGGHADFIQRAHLIVHQRNQRRHDDGDALACTVAGDGRHLVTQALAATGGHQDQGVAAAGHVVDDGLLLTTESRVAKHLVQDLKGCRGRHHRSGNKLAGKRKGELSVLSDGPALQLAGFPVHPSGPLSGGWPAQSLRR